MLPKTPKKASFFGKIVGGVVIFEAVAFGGAYLIWNKLNNSREFREKAKVSAPWALELYYKMGEVVNKRNAVIREVDEKLWSQQEAAKNKTD